MKLDFQNSRRNILWNACPESELNISDESDGIIELNKKYKSQIGKLF